MKVLRSLRGTVPKRSRKVFCSVNDLNMMFRYCANPRPSTSLVETLEHVYCCHLYRTQQEILMTKMGHQLYHNQYFRGIVTDALSACQPRTEEQCVRDSKNRTLYRLRKPSLERCYPMTRNYSTTTTALNVQSSLKTAATNTTKSKIAILRLFRILQRQCTELEQVIKQQQHEQEKELLLKGSKPKRRSKKKNQSSTAGRFLVQAPVDPRRAGSYRFVPLTSMGTTGCTPTEFTDPDLKRIAPLLRFFYLQQDPRNRGDEDDDDENFDSDDDDDSSGDEDDGEDDIDLTESDEEEDELDIDSVLRFFHLQKEYENIKMDYDYDNDDDELDEDKETGEFLTSFVEYILQNEYSFNSKYDLLDSNDEYDSRDEIAAAIDKKDYEIMRTMFESILQKQSVHDFQVDTRRAKKGYENVALWTSVDEIRRTIRYAFRTMQSEDDPDSIRRCVKYAIDAYKVLNIQRAMIPHTYVSTDKNVQITVTCQYIGRSYIPSFRRDREHRRSSNDTETRTNDSLSTNSDKPVNNDNNNNSTSLTNHENEEPKYLYAYRIRIENIGSTDKIQLLGRTWEIYDSHLDDPDVNSVEQTERSQSDDQENISTGQPFRIDAPDDGVVGRFPVLQPGMGFEYISGAEAGPYGRMKGSFHFATLKNTGTNSLTTTGNHHRRSATEVNKNVERNDDDYDNDDLNGYDICLTKQESKLFKNRFTVPVKPFPLRAV